MKSSTPNQVTIFVEMLPCGFRDAVRNAGIHADDGRTLKGVVSYEDTLGFQTLSDAVIHADALGARLVDYVPAKNLLFLIGQRSQPLMDALSFEISGLLTKGPLSDLLDRDNEQQCSGEQKGQADKFAIVAVKVAQAEKFKTLVGQDQKHSDGQGDCCRISWNELQALHKKFNRRQGIRHQLEVILAEEQIADKRDSADLHFLTCARNGETPGASGGEKRCRRIRDAIDDLEADLHGIDPRAVKGACEHLLKTAGLKPEHSDAA